MMQFPQSVVTDVRQEAAITFAIVLLVLFSLLAISFIVSFVDRAL